MFVNRLIHCIALLSLVGVAGVEARAEPMLLIEITAEGASQRSFSGEPVYMAFLTEDAAGIEQGVLGGFYDAADVGMTFEASPEVLAGIEEALTNAGHFAIDTGNNAPPQSFRADRIWTLDRADWEITRHVPRLGDGLSGYDLSAITQTIDQISYQQIGIEIFSTQRHSIRMFGEPIPEPGCLLLAAHCALVGLAWGKRVRITVRLIDKTN